MHPGEPLPFWNSHSQLANIGQRTQLGATVSRKIEAAGRNSLTALRMPFHGVPSLDQALPST
jgi:hypothetical protein